jgi:hypothetical protein
MDKTIADYQEMGQDEAAGEEIPLDTSGDEPAAEEEDPVDKLMGDENADDAEEDASEETTE